MFVRKYTWVLAVPLILASLSAWAAFERVNEPNPGDSMKVHIYRLDNGLTVYLSENHETPRFYAEIAVRAGSKHDPPETTGLAHYLEHLLFKGTRRMGTLDYASEASVLEAISRLYEEHFREGDAEKRAAIYAQINRVAKEASQFAIANEIDKLYTAMGATSVNAYTSNEQTVYMVSLPANRLSHWAIIESERFTQPVFRLFHTELETVYEEKNRSLDNKGRIIQEAVAEALFKVHPYGQQSTIGRVEHLKRPSLVNITNFYKTHYVPNNMAISISGDIDIDDTIRLVDQHFSRWRSRPLPEPKTWAEKPLDGVERVTARYQGEEYVLLAFRTAPRGHKDAEALALLDMILDNSTAGLINLNLNQQQKVRAAGSNPRFRNDYGVQFLWGIPKDGQTLEEVEQLLLEQLELVKNGKFENWILPAINTDFKKSEKARLESDRARVSAMTDAFVGFTDWDYAVAELARMEKVTKRRIVKVAKRYFGGDYVAGYRVDEQHDVPSIVKPHIDPVEIDPRRQSAFAKEVLAIEYREIRPVFVDPGKDYSIVDEGTGVKIYYAPNPLNDLFSFSIVVDFGSHEDNKIAIAARLLDKSGAGELTPEELKKEWYRLGTDFSISAGENESVIAISGLDENFEASLALLVEVLTHPTADKPTLDELISIILVQRADAKKNPGTIHRALYNYNRYGTDSYFLQMLPAEGLKKLTVGELHGLISKLLGYKHTITYTGSLPLEEFQKVLNKHHPIEGPLEDPPPYRFRTARTTEENEIYFFNKRMAQAQVRIEFPDGVFDEQEQTGVDLYNSYFAGGMSGIVFQELREARGLAYSAAARYITGSREKDENLMAGVIECQADKTPEALDAFLGLFDDLSESPERFTETKNALISRYRSSKIGFRGVLGAVRAWERLGVPIDPRKERFERVQEAEIVDLMAFHEQHIKGRPKLISIVGDKARIDMDRLGALGKVVEIGLEQIFVD